MARSVTGAFRAVKVVWRQKFEHDRSYEREFIGLKQFEPISRQHDGLVDVLQVGRSEDCFYCVMELADAVEPTGEYEPLTLGEYIRRHGRLSAVECARIGADVAEALAFLHRSGLVHRDVKPSNIIFVNGRPKLADIGLVTSIGAARSFVGTDGFIPPEGPGAPAGDIYGLGKTLYEMATGRNRLDFPDLPSNLDAQGDGGAFVELNEIILRACGPNAGERHASAEELRGELLLLESGRSIRRLRRNERLLTFWRRAGLAVGLALLAVAAGFAWERSRAETARLDALAHKEQRQLVEEKEKRARENLYAADMNLAQQAIEAGNYGRAHTLLSAYLPVGGVDDLRGFEWRFYWQLVQGDSLGVLRGHEQVISSLSLSRDGKRLFSASFDSTIREWSLHNRRQLRKWDLPGCMFSAISLNNSESYLACEGGNRRFSAILDLQTGAWVTNFSNESPSISFAPGDQLLARGANALIFSTNGLTEIVDRNFRVQKVLPESGGRVAFSPDGKFLATGAWGDSIKLWTWPDLKGAGVLHGAGIVMWLEFSPDSRHLASVARDGRLILWDIQARQLLAQKTTHGGSVIWSVSFSPDGTRLATGGNDQAVRTWDADSLAERHIYRGHGSEVWSVKWTRDGAGLISAGKDGTIRLWTATPPEPAPELFDIAQRPVFSANNRWMAVRYRKGGATIWDLHQGRAIHHLEDAWELGGFKEDGRLILLGLNGSVQQFDVVARKIISSNPVGEFKADYAKRLMSSGGRWIATAYRNGDVLLHETATNGPPILLKAHNELILSLAFSEDEKHLLTGSIDRTARLWDLSSRKILREFSNHKMGVGALAFSPDGKRIATGSWDDSLHVWNAESGKELMILEGHDGGVQAIAFAPDERTLLSLTGASILKIWNLRAQREAGQIQLRAGVHQGSLALSPNGEWLAVVSQAESLKLFHAPQEKILTSR